jgi:glucose-6-phosphate dehydrogenase assembly protein OpcA
VADTYKVLGQSDPVAATLTTLYTVPAATSAIVSSVTVCNRSAVATSFRIAVRPAGAAIANQHYLAFDVPIAANEAMSFTLGVTLATTDVLSIFATLATLSFNAYGVEKT